MAKTFYIPSLNPIPFRKLVEINDRYNTIPFDLLPTQKTVTGCYYQPWQFTDSTTIQFDSDYPVTIEVIPLGSQQANAVIPAIEVATNIIGQTFKVFQAEFDFSDYGNGYFYAQISYTDDDEVENFYQSQPWHTAPKHEDTLLFEYKNSFNNYSVEFEKTGVIFNTRFEAQISPYSPQFEDDLYTDQLHNNTQLSSVTYDQFKLTTRLMPDWSIKLLNAVMNVDEKKIDNVYFEKTTGAKLDVIRPEGTGNPYGYATIDVVPIEDFFLQRLKSGDMPDGLYTIITKRRQFKDNAINRTLTGDIKANTNLRRIDITNKVGVAFTIKIGTTAGASDIAIGDIADTDATYTILPHRFFDSPETLYISGIAGVQLDIFIIFDQDDLPDVNINSGESTGLFPKNFEGYFTVIDEGDLEANWDLASGLGKPNTRYSNCAIRDGRNGTYDDTDTYDIAVAIGSTALLGTEIGSNSTVLTIPNLPPNDIPFGTDFKGGGSGIKVLSVDVPGPTGTINKGVGGTSVPIENRPKSRYKLPFIAITD